MSKNHYTRLKQAYLYSVFFCISAWQRVVESTALVQHYKKRENIKKTRVQHDSTGVKQEATRVQQEYNTTQHECNTAQLEYKEAQAAKIGLYFALFVTELHGFS